MARQIDRAVRVEPFDGARNSTDLVYNNAGRRRADENRWQTIQDARQMLHFNSK